MGKKRHSGDNWVDVNQNPYVGFFMKKCVTADKCSSFYLHPIKHLKCNKGPSQSCFLFPHDKTQINTSSTEVKLPGQRAHGI